MTPRLVLLCARSAAGAVRANRVASACRADGMVEVARVREVVVLAAPASASRRGDLVISGRLVGDPSAAGGLVDPSPRAAAERLVEDCWGDYVAVLLSSSGTHLMADPTGAGRAHVCRDADLVLATDALTPTLCRSAGFAPSMDERVLAGGLVDPPSLVLADLLTGVHCLRPGTLTPVEGTGSEEVIWSPRRVREGRRGASPDLAAAVDRAVAGTRGPSPLVQVSGGLDSAIVLTAAARMGTAFALTVVGDAGDVDESRYARAAARKAGVSLVVAKDEALPDFSVFMEAEQTAHPFLHGLDDVFDDRMQAAVRRSGCDRVLTGQGGDAVFLQIASFATTVDRLADRGVSALASGLLDDAVRNRSSVWGPLAAVARHLLRGTATPEQTPLTPHLLTRDALAGARRPQHPWTLERDPTRPGRELQARLLANATIVHTRRPRPPSVPLLSPLLAQPVLEAVLSMPTWLLASGPRDRGLARRVFADRLPASIVGRSIKGQATTLFSHAVERNLPLLRERLLNGSLVRRGVLDRAAVDATLRRDHLAHSSDFRSLMFVAACEAWTSAWS